MLGESRPLSVLALGAARAATGLRPRVSCGPFSPAALTALPTPGASSSAARPGGLLGVCRGISFRRRAGKQRVRSHKPVTAKLRKVLCQPLFQWKVYKGDMVGVNRGPFMGMAGEVIRTHKKYHALRVKGVNLVKRKVWDHKTDPDQPRRVWVELEEPIHYSRVQLLDPVSQELTNVDFRYLETGERVRIAKASGAVAPKPVFNKPERPAHTLLASPFDTAVEDAHEVTYKPRGIPNYINNMATGAEPRYVAYPRRMKLLTKRAKVKAKDKLTYQDKRARQAQHKHEVREDARKRRYVLPEVLQHLLPGIRPPSASYLARVAAAHAAAVQAGA